MSSRRRPTPLLLLTALALAAPAAPALGAEPTDAAAPPGAEAPRRVVFLPEAVRAQLKEELKAEVLAQAREEGWAAPGALPAWTKRFSLHADVRLRMELVFFQPGNASTGEFPDFNAINAGAPFDVLGVDLANERYLNVDQNRLRPRLRARLGVDVDLGAGFLVQLRVASGEGSTPVSTNQTLGGSAGNFSKYQVWLDRAALRFDPFHGQKLGFVLQGGRFGNPFLATGLVWWDDLSFDGLALQAWAGADWFRVFLNGGAFPYFVTGLDYPAEQSIKLPTFNKWLFGGQLGVELTPAQALTLKLAGAYYYFDQVQGRVGGPCDTNLKGFSCDTDATRPGFAQKGNTYRMLRTPSVAALAAEAAGLASEYQYFGLASLFRELVLTARVEVRPLSWLQVALDGEFARNLGFSTPRIAPVAVNNLGACDDQHRCPFVGGLNGYLGRISVGSPVLGPQGSWRVAFTYRHLESDAVVDAFTDPEFALGGTNNQGYTVSASVALVEGVLFNARWLSSNAVSGPPLAVDVLHLEVAARY